MLWRRRDEKPAMDLRRLCCAGLCACGVALVVLVVPSLRFILASQAGLAAGRRAAAMPPNVLALGRRVGSGYGLFQRRHSAKNCRPQLCVTLGSNGMCDTLCAVARFALRRALGWASREAQCVWHTSRCGTAGLGGFQK